MGKTSVIIYITVAVLLLLFLSQSPKSPRHHRHSGGGRHRRLKLRSNFTFSPPTTTTTANPHHQEHHFAFDPLVADMEMKREDREWERKYTETRHSELTQSQHAAPGEESQPEWEDFMDDEDYLNDEEKFNITNRLVLLFPKIDVSPSDGFVSEAELTQWNLEQTQREVLHRTQRELEIHDKNKDGLVSYSEYEPPSWVKHSENSSFGYEMGWWKEEHFNAADADGDGLLNLTEFNDFLHPADTKKSQTAQLVMQGRNQGLKARQERYEIGEENFALLWPFGWGLSGWFSGSWERDSDRDGKVNFNEFFHGLFDMVRNFDDKDHSSAHESDNPEEAPAKKLFAVLDKDGDGFLSDVELLPLIGKLHPSEHYYAKQQSEYIIEQADSDKDGRLTLREMIDSPYVFYSAIFNDDEDEDYEYHDEFR